MRVRKSIAVCAVLAAAVTLVWMERGAIFRDLRASLRNPGVPGAMLRFGTLGKILRDNHLVHLRFQSGEETSQDASPDDAASLSAADAPEDAAHVTLELRSLFPTKFKVFWKTQRESFDEERTALCWLNPHIERYHLILPPLARDSILRIDPMDRPGTLIIKRLEIRQKGYLPLVLHTASDFGKLTPVQQIDLMKFQPGVGLSLHADGGDPQLRFAPRLSLDLYDSIFQRKRRPGKTSFSSRPGIDLASTLAHPAVRDAVAPYAHLPLLVVTMAEADLTDPKRGVQANPFQRGRAWERPAYMAYSEGDQIRLQTGVGIRLHGGDKGRAKEIYSFRLYFRQEYGPGLLDGSSALGPEWGRLDRLVLHTTAWPPGMPFNNPLAYDIARRIGCNAHPVKLVCLILNNRVKGLYFLTKQISRQQLRADLGHPEFDLWRAKSINEDNARNLPYKEHFVSLVNRPDGVTMEMVQRSVDLDELIRHIFSWVYCATTDFCQGGWVRDRRGDARSHWWNWDMDHSFVDVDRMLYKLHLERREWQQPGWKMSGMDSCERSALLLRLLRDDPHVRPHVIRIVSEVLNHRLTPEFLAERLEYYRAVVAPMGGRYDDYMDMLDEFFAHRHEFIRQEMQTFLGIEAWHRCRIDVPEGTHVLIDGQRHVGRYTGHYSQDAPLTVAVSDADPAAPTRWMVNGELRVGAALELAVRGDLEIRLLDGHH